MEKSILSSFPKIFLLHFLALPLIIGQNIQEDELLVTVLPARVIPSKVPPGSPFKLILNWDVKKPLSDQYQIFLHFLDANDRIVLQGDHEPPLTQTNLPQFKGRISYEKRFIVPKDLLDGSYRIVVGLYNKNGRLKL